MTTTVKINCNGPNYRTVATQRGISSYIYSGENNEPNPEYSFHVGQDSSLSITEEYSDSGWDRTTNTPKA